MGAHGNAPRAAREGFYARGEERRSALLALAGRRLIAPLAELPRRILPSGRCGLVSSAGLAPRFAHLATGRSLGLGTILVSWERALARTIRSCHGAWAARAM